MSTVVYESHFDDVLKELSDKVPAALEAVGIAAEGYAKLELENSPRRIDTGRLRNSIAHAVSGDTEVQIGSNVEYALYVHEGTYKMAPNRYLKNAIENNADAIKAIFEEYLKE